ncbi:MAG: hypothetical protein HYX35_03080 [Proteobacteria bacterium]|nr:hypothetical protein [Pseudomonadota bacterium]
MKIKFLLMALILSSSLSLWACEVEERLETLENKVTTVRQLLNSESLETIDGVKQQLVLMVDLDQDVRNLFMEDVNNPKIRKLLEHIDRFHTEHLKAILKQYGWITISKFGKEADHQAWLLVQHADRDPNFQKRCVSTLEKLWPLNETDRKNYAYLYDRVAVNHGLKQRYGTQAKIENNQIELLPFEGSSNNLNEHRQEMGLAPIEEYLETLKRAYTRKKLR